MNTTSDHTAFASGTHLCWRSVAAGTLVALLVYATLSALGAGVGGFTVAHIIDKNESTSGLLAGAAIWLAVSTVVSLFLGAYFATRYSSVRHKQIGAAQGILISAVFFFIVLHSSGSSIGNLSSFAGNIAGQSPATAQAEEAARLIGDAGWTLFASFVFGIAAATLGGLEGVLGNRKRPFAQTA